MDFGIRSMNYYRIHYINVLHTYFASQKHEREGFVNLTTLYNVILRIARNLPETKETIKIESHPFSHIICD